MCNEDTNEHSDMLRTEFESAEELKKKKEKKKKCLEHYTESIPLHKTTKKKNMFECTGGHWRSAAKAMLMSHQGMQTQFAP